MIKFLIIVALCPVFSRDLPLAPRSHPVSLLVSAEQVDAPRDDCSTGGSVRAAGDPRRFLAEVVADLFRSEKEDSEDQQVLANAPLGLRLLPDWLPELTAIRARFLMAGDFTNDDVSRRRC